jgi:hypothetical protein
LFIANQVDAYQPFLITPTTAGHKTGNSPQNVRQDNELTPVSPDKEYLADVLTGVVIVFYDKQGRAQGLSHLSITKFDPVAFHKKFNSYLTNDYRFLIIRGPQQLPHLQADFIKNLSDYLRSNTDSSKNIFIYDSGNYRKSPSSEDISMVLEKSGTVKAVFISRDYRQLGADEITPNRAMQALHTSVHQTQEDLGGIDLTLANNVLQAQKDGKEIKFHIDPAQLAQLQNASGFVPVIISIRPMTNLRLFLGSTDS